MSKNCWNVYTNVNGKTIEFQNAKEFSEYLSQNPVELDRFSNSINLTEQVSTNIKEGVAELFESNTELAKEVYEALGFGNFDKTYNYKRDIVNKFEADVETIINGMRNVSIADNVDYDIELELKLAKENNINHFTWKDENDITHYIFYNQKGEYQANEILKIKNLHGTSKYQAQLGYLLQYDLEDVSNFTNVSINEIDRLITPQQKQQAQQIYSSYLDSIFPDSKVKDIVYHGTDVIFENFDFTKEGKRNKGHGFYFSVFKQAAENYGKNIIPVLLNSKNIKEINITRGQNYGDVGRVFRNSNYDTIYGFSDLNRNREFNDIYNSEYVVFEPEQIHILGSKQDIEGFKEFVDSKPITTKFSIKDKLKSKTNKTPEATKVDELLETTTPQVDSTVNLSILDSNLQTTTEVLPTIQVEAVEDKVEVVTEKPTEELQKQAEAEVAKIEEVGATIKSLELNELNDKQRDAFNYLKENFSDLEVGIVKELSEDGKVNGYFDTAAGVMLDANGPIVETAHHESFHVLFTNYLTPAQQEILLEEAKKTYKIDEGLIKILAERYNKDLSNPKAREIIEKLAYEEAMAEDFVTYMQTGESIAKADIRSFFVRLLEFLGKLFKKAEFGNIRTTFEILERREGSKFMKKNLTVDLKKYSRKNDLNLTIPENNAFVSKLYNDVYRTLSEKVAEGNPFSFKELTTDPKRFYADLSLILSDLVTKYENGDSEVARKAIANLEKTENLSIKNIKFGRNEVLETYSNLVYKDIEEALDYLANTIQIDNNKLDILEDEYPEILEKINETTEAILLGLSNLMNENQYRSLLDRMKSGDITQSDFRMKKVTDYTPIVDSLNSYLRKNGIKIKINPEFINEQNAIDITEEIIEESTDIASDTFENQNTIEGEEFKGKEFNFNFDDTEVNMNNKLTSELKLFLATIPSKIGNKIETIAGEIKYLTPAEAYKTLLTYAKNSNSIEEIKEAIYDLASKRTEFQPVADLISVDVTKLPRVAVNSASDVYSHTASHIHKLQQSLYRSLYKASVSYLQMEEKNGEFNLTNPQITAQALSFIDKMDVAYRKMYNDEIASSNGKLKSGDKIGGVFIKDNILYIQKDQFKSSLKSALPFIAKEFGSEHQSEFLNLKLENLTGNNSLKELYDDQSEFRNSIKDFVQIIDSSSQHSFTRVDGKKVYGIIEKNADSVTLNHINKAKTLEELREMLPHLNSLTNKNAMLFKLMFDENGNKRKDFTINSVIKSGLSADSGGVVIADASTLDKDFFTYSLLLNGTGLMTTPSDKSLYFGFETTGENSISSTLYTSDVDTLKEFMLDEITDEATRAVASRMGLFEYQSQYNIKNFDKNSQNIVLYENWVKPNVNAELEQFVNKFKEQINSIEDLQLPQYRNVLKTYLRANFNENYLEERASANKNTFNKYKNLISKAKMQKNNQFKSAIAKEDFFEKLSIMEALMYSQSFHLILGDAAMYKNIDDLYKRAGGPKGTKEMLLPSEKSLSEFQYLFGDTGIGNLDAMYSKSVVVDKVEVSLSEESINQIKETIAPYLRKEILFHAEVNGQNLTESQINKLVEEGVSLRTKSLSGINEADGQSWITLEGYRWFKYLMGEWNWKSELAYRKAVIGESLTEEELTYFQPVKSQYFGPANIKDVNLQTFLKHSMYPILPAYFKQGDKITDQGLKTLVDDLNSRGTTILNTNDAVKTSIVYNKEGFKKLYTTDAEGNVVFNDLNDLPEQVLDNRYFGIQVRVDNKVKTENIIGSQGRKILPEGFIFNGTYLPASFPVYNTKGELVDMEEETSDNTATIANKLNTSIDALMEYGISQIEKQLGLEKVETDNFLLRQVKYKIKDVAAFREKIDSLAESNELAYNVREAISNLEKVEGTDVLTINFDAFPDTESFQKLLVSFIHKNTVGAKIKGGGKIQGAPSLFDLGAKSFDAKKGFIQSDKGLKFYRMSKVNGKDVTLPAQIKLAPDLEQTKFIRLIAEEKGISFNQALVEVNKAIKELTNDAVRFDEKAKSKIYNKYGFILPLEVLKIVGYRIPTQAAASMEILEIAEFLPLESGELVVVPTGFTAKNGSDFDIDKLFTMSSHFSVGEIDVLSKIENDFINKISGYTSLSQTQIDEILETGTTNGLSKPVKRQIKLDYSDFKKSMSRASNKPIISLYRGKNKLKNLHNSFSQNYKDILQSPNYLTQLINPLDTSNLKDWVTENLGSKAKGSLSKALTREFNNVMSDSFIAGKREVGTMATNVTSHKNFQRAGIEMDKNFYTKLRFEGMGEYYNIAGEYDYRGVNGLKISDSLKELTNGAVDAAKDPWLFDVNMVSPTASVGIYLLRRGVPYETVLSFMSSPIITDVRIALTNNKGILPTLRGVPSELRSKFKSTVVELVAMNYAKPQELAEFISSYSALRKDETEKIHKQFLNFEINEDFINNPDNAIKILFTYLVSEYPANELTKITLATTFDTSKPEGIADAYLKHIERSDILIRTEEGWKANADHFRGVEKIITNTLLNSFSKVDEIYRGAFVNNLLISNPLVLLELRGLMKGYRGSNAKRTSKLFSNYVNGFMPYLFQVLGYTDPNIKTSFISAELFVDLQNSKSENSLVSVIVNKETYVLSETGEEISFNIDNAFLDSIFISKNKSNTQRGISLLSRGVNNFDVNEQIEGFEEVSQIIKDKINPNSFHLEALAIVQGGLNKSPYYFWNLIPYGDFTLKMNDYLNKVTGGNLTNVNDTLRTLLNRYSGAFMLNNIGDSGLVPLENEETFFDEEEDSLEIKDFGITKIYDQKTNSYTVLKAKVIRPIQSNKVIESIPADKISKGLLLLDKSISFADTLNDPKLIPNIVELSLKEKCKK